MRAHAVCTAPHRARSLRGQPRVSLRRHAIGHDTLAAQHRPLLDSIGPRPWPSTSHRREQRLPEPGSTEPAGLGFPCAFLMSILGVRATLASGYGVAAGLPGCSTGGPWSRPSRAGGRGRAVRSRRVGRRCAGRATSRPRTSGGAGAGSVGGRSGRSGRAHRAEGCFSDCEPWFYVLTWSALNDAWNWFGVAYPNVERRRF